MHDVAVALHSDRAATRCEVSKCVVAAAADAMKANAKWPCLLTVLLWFALYKGIFKAGDLLFEKPRIVVTTAPRWWWKPPPNASRLQHL